MAARVKALEINEDMIESMKRLNFDRTIKEIKVLSKSERRKSYMISVISKTKGNAWTCHVPVNKMTALRLAYPNLQVSWPHD